MNRYPVKEPDMNTLTNAIAASRPVLANRGKSAAHRQKMRQFSAADVFDSFASQQEGAKCSEVWPLRLRIQRDKWGGWLTMQHEHRNRTVRYRLLSVRGDWLMPYLDVHEFCSAIRSLFLFEAEPAETLTLWRFEIKDRAEHDAEFTRLLELTKASLADVHLTHTGTAYRVYCLGGEVLVEYVISGQEYLRLSGITGFLNNEEKIK